MYRNLLLSSRVVRAEGGRGEVAEGRGPQRFIDKTQVDHLVVWQSFKCGLLDVSRTTSARPLAAPGPAARLGVEL